MVLVDPAVAGKKHFRFGGVRDPNKPEVFTGLKKKDIGLSSRCHTYESFVIFKKTNPKTRCFHRLACFWRRVRESAIMAMNSELVGLPLMFDTV